MQLLVFRDDSAQFLLDKISTSSQRVLMTMYLLTDYRFISALQTAQRNGADVRVLLEESPFRGESAARQAHIKLVNAGINVRFSSPAFRFTHQKSLVVDDTAVIMTENLTKSAFSSNRGFAVICSTVSEVSEMADTFEADWSRTKTTHRSKYLVWSPTSARSQISNLINSAHKSIDIYAEVTQDDGITELLILAVQRNVTVRLITSPQLDSADTSNKRDSDMMRSGGVGIGYLKNPYIHAKMILVDEQMAFVGSQNISATSLEFNRELGILISDPIATGQLHSTFQKDWDKSSGSGGK